VREGKIIKEAALLKVEAKPNRVQLLSGFVTVRRGQSLWRIARSVYGRGTQYTLIYESNQDQIRDPDLIYPGQIFSLPTALDRQ
jgi:nucleoid-associated protein YgaU